MNTPQSRRKLLSVGAALALSTNIRPARAEVLPEGIPAGSIRATVTAHLDGDKFKVAINGKEETVLLIAVDAPEIATPDK